MATGPDAGGWTLPGGGVEQGEHPDESVLRELMEEAGIDGVVAGPVLAIYSQVYERTPERPWGPIHHVGIVYRVEGVGRRLRFEQDGSTDRCDWFARDEVSAVPLVPLGEFGVGLAWSQ